MNSIKYEFIVKYKKLEINLKLKETLEKCKILLPFFCKNGFAAR